MSTFPFAGVTTLDNAVEMIQVHLINESLFYLYIAFIITSPNKGNHLKKQCRGALEYFSI